MPRSKWDCLGHRILKCLSFSSLCAFRFVSDISNMKSFNQNRYSIMFKLLPYLDIRLLNSIQISGFHYYNGQTFCLWKEVQGAEQFWSILFRFLGAQQVAPDLGRIK